MQSPNMPFKSEGRKVHSLYKRSHDLFAAVACLKDCANHKDLQRGIGIYAEVARQGYDKDLFVCSTLTDLFAKCGLLARAEELFGWLNVRDTVLWNILLAEFSKQGHGEKALKCLEQMLLEGFPPDDVTFICSLKACASMGFVCKGQVLHVMTYEQNSFGADMNVGNALIDMYAKCGSLAKAREVLNNIASQDTVSWNALISGCVKRGLVQEALTYYRQMRMEGVFSDAITFASILKACSSSMTSERGCELHAEICVNGLLEEDLIVGNALVDMYAKCGLLRKAHEVFDNLPVKDAVSWTSLITGYSTYGHGEQALNCYESMGCHGIYLDDVTLLCALKACSSVGDVGKGQEIHCEFARKGLLERDLVGNTLVDMYAKCGSIMKAQDVFDTLQAQDVVSWNVLIGGYTDHGYAEKALDLFNQMQQKGVSRDPVTCIYALKACGMEGAITVGRRIHSEISRNGWMKRDNLLTNALIDMYAKCGEFANAQDLFQELPVHSSASWNGLISGYIQHGFYEEALDCFDEMQRQEISPDAATFVSCLKVCGNAGMADKGCEIHAQVMKEDLLQNDPIIGNVLVDMYSTCGLLTKAHEVFDMLSIQDVVAWTALIAGHVKHGRFEEALAIYEKMDGEGVSPNAVTYICVVIACGNIGAADKGQEIHAFVARKGLERDLILGNALVDMYSNCGMLNRALEVFTKLPDQSIVSWTALISGFAVLGEIDEVFLLFHKMSMESFVPNHITFISIINACSHAGLVDVGQLCFQHISGRYQVIPTVEHYTSMVDLFSRSGQLDKAIEVAKRMPYHPNLILWHTILGACRKWASVELGKQAFEHVVQYDNEDAVAYVSMSNIYADVEGFEEPNPLEPREDLRTLLLTQSNSIRGSATDVGPQNNTSADLLMETSADNMSPSNEKSRGDGMLTAA